MHSKPDGSRNDAFPTLTHARIRAEQGDRSGARHVLRRVLEREPWNREARDFFEQLAGADRSRTPVRGEAAQDPPEPATAAELADRFKRALGGGADRRIEKLNAWLGRIPHQNGGNDAG